PSDRYLPQGVQRPINRCPLLLKLLDEVLYLVQSVSLGGADTLSLTLARVGFQSASQDVMFQKTSCPLLHMTENRTQGLRMQFQVFAWLVSVVHSRRWTRSAS